MKHLTVLLLLFLPIIGCGASDYRIRLSNAIELIRTSPGESSLVVNQTVLVSSKNGIALAIFNDILYYSINTEDADISNDQFGCISLNGIESVIDTTKDKLIALAGIDITSKLKRPTKHSDKLDFIAK